jgi:hypothetical protein
LKKITIKKWSIVQKIYKPLSGAVFALWLFGISIQVIQSFVHQEYSMFKDYGEIALTVFGFTLIGGIFENKKEHPMIVKKLFDSSLSFLITATSFFFLYSISSVYTKDMVPMENFQTALIVGSTFFAMLIAFYGIITGLLNLFGVLVDYRVFLDQK